MDAPDTGRLSHIYQLSGFADPVYAEACVTVHDYDIVLEVGWSLSRFASTYGVAAVARPTVSATTNLTIMWWSCVYVISLLLVGFCFSCLTSGHW